MPDSQDSYSEVNTTGAWYPPQGRAPSGPILVATDGEPPGKAAFAAASSIGAKLAAKVRVVVVVEPLPVLVPEPSVIMQPLVASPELLDVVRNRVVAQLQEIAPKGSDLHVEVEYGRPSAGIVDRAWHHEAQLIVIGLVHHGLIDRILDGDTALEVIRHSASPVLLVSPRWTELPKRAVFAVDFSADSMAAARAAVRILDDAARIYLAHVRPMPGAFDGTGMWEAEYENAATNELERFKAALGAPSGMHVEQVLLTGSASAALLGFAEKTESDLIVSGTRGAGLMQRILVGSVATRLMRHSDRSVLVAPTGKTEAER